jgi:ATP-dependent protease ClpP protease subunit
MPNEIKLYGVIGEDIRAVEVKQQIDAMDQSQPLVVRIHSEGGSVADGLAIYDAFQAYAGQKKAVIESAAFSIASYIAMAFEDVEITENGYLMIHNPHMEISGDDAALAHGSSVLSKLKESMVNAYASKTGKGTDEVLSIMAAETWVNAQEALAAGYVNRIAPPKKVKAVARLVKMPQRVFASLCSDGSDAVAKRVEQKEKPMSNTQPVAASLAEIKAAFPKAKAEFVLNCIERQLPMASVMTEALAAMEEELQEVKAKLAQYEQKEQESQAKSMQDEEEMKAKAMETEEDDDEEPEAKVKAKAKLGVKPVAKSASGSMPKQSATAQWTGAVSAKVNGGLSRAQAIHAVERDFPGLRLQMIEEANASR